MRNNKAHALAVIRAALESAKFCPQLQNEVSEYRWAIYEARDAAAIEQLVRDLVTVLSAHTCNDHN